MAWQLRLLETQQQQEHEWQRIFEEERQQLQQLQREIFEMQRQCWASLEEQQPQQGDSRPARRAQHARPAQPASKRSRFATPGPAADQPTTSGARRAAAPRDRGHAPPTEEGQEGGIRADFTTPQQPARRQAWRTSRAQDLAERVGEDDSGPRLVPVLVVYTGRPNRSEEWQLLGRKLFLSSLPPDISDAKVQELLEGAGATGGAPPGLVSWCRRSKLLLDLRTAGTLTLTRTRSYQCTLGHSSAFPATCSARLPGHQQR
jgi:hypothetical protein